MKKFDEIFGPKKSLQDLYTDFKTSDQIALENFESNNPGEDRSKYTSIMNLLFPRSPDGILDGPSLWEKIKQLKAPAEAENENDNKNAEFIASKIRLYHYAGISEGGDPNGSSTASKEISDFYEKEGKRPSAYNCQIAGQFEHVDDALTKLINTTVANVIPSSDAGEAAMKSAITMILVDEPSIDLKIRNAGITSTFINYMPGIMVSQMVPFLDVRFSFQRKGAGDLGQTTMTPLKFLMGAQNVPIEGDPSATRYIYDAYTAKKIKQEIKTNLGETEENMNRAIAANSASGRRAEKNASTVGTSSRTESTEQITTTGMEMFCMPQTLINMDYDQETVPRYNPVLNSTLPFGTIQSFVINVTSAGHGIFSYKTGTLSLKIFDRSRLIEIADFLNPKLYGKATLWITYGWRAPYQTNEGIDRNEYLAMINENMLKREAYGISNSSISIGDDGTATVQLQLFMKFSNELSQASPTLGSAQFDLEQTKIENKMAEIREIAQKLGLGSSDVKDIRGGIIIGAALNGSMPTGDPAILRKELDTIKNSFSNQTDPNITKFLQLSSELYTVAQGSTKSSGATSLDAAAAATTSNRFDVLKNSNSLDVWSVPVSDSSNKFKQDGGGEEFIHPLQKMHKLLVDNKVTFLNDGSGRQLTSNEFGSFGTISFARLIATYLATTALTIEDNNVLVDEYQIIFYKLNDLAGPVAGINIGEFPIDMDSLQKAYSEAIIKQKGENMTLLNFLEIVRASQLGNQRHHAYGFSDLYNAEGKLDNTQGTASDKLLQRQLQNSGLGGSFVVPAIDFYVETANSSNENSITDLLTSFEVASTFSTKAYTPEGYKKIVRIHIYDKATIPHKAAADILKSQIDGSYVEAENAYKRKIRAEVDKSIQEISEKEKNISQRNKKITERTQAVSATEIKQNNDKVTFKVGDAQYSANTRLISFRDSNGRPRFELAKREIARLVPTITIGTNGTTIKTVNYGSEQDAKLATIMMLRNTDSFQNENSPNGSASGDLPLRVIPGSLSITTLGCPLLEYMQQFFIDLGTGTTIDNLYNITSLTHNISPGNFTSDIKFSFADAYGKYESPQSITTKLQSEVQLIAKQAKEATQAKARATAPAKPAKK